MNGMESPANGKEADLYGFNDFNPILDVDNLEADEQFTEAVKTSYGNRPIKTGRAGTAARLATGARAPGPEGEEGPARPMTAVKSAGFVSASRVVTGAADPMGAQPGQPPADLLNPVDDKDTGIRKLERTVHELIENSTSLVRANDTAKAIEAAKEASTKEKQLSRLREEDNPDTVNIELTFAVQVNLGCIYQQTNMFSEALHTYQSIVKNKAFEKAGRLRVNMGNIYFTQKKYLQAIKQYRMSLDQIPFVHQLMRNKVMKNIGHAFVEMGQYAEAIASYEHVLEQRPTREIGGVERKMAGHDSVTAFNLLLCYFALGDRDSMQGAFQTLLEQELSVSADDERYVNLHNDEHVQIVLDVITQDSLALHEEKEKRTAEKLVVMAAKLIAPVIENTFSAGFDWCIHLVRQSRYAELAAELEITKAVTYLKAREFKKAVEVLKTFEKTESKMKSAAATNLSFLYFLQSQYAQADKYADVAMKADKYNCLALVNKGNCLFVNDQVEEAISFYNEALQVESSNPEALFNLGLCHKKVETFEQALQWFLELYAVLPNSAEVIFQVAHCYEKLGDLDNACDWFLKLISVAPTDPNALAHLGTLFDLDNDKSQAFQYHFEAFRFFPSSMRTVEWLGAYYVDSQYPEKAIQYFERAAMVQPGEVKWRLMEASCYRRSGNYREALKLYKKINSRFPDNIDCLNLLVRLCGELKLAEVDEYKQLLAKAEKAKELKGARESSGKRGRRSGRTRSGRESKGSASSSGSGNSANRRGNSGAVRADEAAPGLPVDLPKMASSIDPTAHEYHDPMGAAPVRPKTAANRAPEVDEWDDVDMDDGMLPD